LFVTLFWLKNYDPNDVLGELFGLWWGDVCRLLKRTLTALDMALQNEIRWPEEQKWKRSFSIFPFTSQNHSIKLELLFMVHF
jgi:hypothetical protein